LGGESGGGEEEEGKEDGEAEYGHDQTLPLDEFVNGPRQVLEHNAVTL
jgi:hypothetical protein